MQPISPRASYHFGLVPFLGLVLLVWFFFQPSEAFGLSKTRLAIGALFLLLLVASLGLPRLVAALENPLNSANGLSAALTGLYALLLGTGLALVLTFLPVARSLAWITAVFSRAACLLAWIFVSSGLLLHWLAHNYRTAIREKKLFSPLRLTAWGLMLLAAYTLVLIEYREAAYVISLRQAEFPLFGLGLYLLVAAALSERISNPKLHLVLLLGGIFLTTFIFYEQIAMWIGWVGKTRYTYWNLLAEQFLHGKLYLENPPTTHDLALFNQHWYVPMPPLPALVMLPLAFGIGGEQINTIDFSIFFSALNALLLFLILDGLRGHSWLKLSRGALLWLVVLFAFGTNHLWVGLSGRAWFVSQVLTVTCLALATLAALKGQSAWVVGLCLGLAMAARPNSVMFWPFPLALAFQVRQEAGEKPDWKWAATWLLKIAAPMALAILGLLLYNQARFGNFLDFGYTLLEGDPTIVANAKTSGLFSWRFIPNNLRVMFLEIPSLQPGGSWPILPSGAGMSLFLSTPPLVYLFHRYEKRGWISGAWATTLLMFALLALYHNTGADQFGYRYLLDMLVPLIALLAYTLGEKVPWHFSALTLASIAINIYGAAWFMNG